MKKYWFLIIVFIFGLRGNILGLSIDIDPTVIQISLKPGGSYSGTITVKSTSKKPLEVTSSQLDWDYESPQGAKKFYPLGTTDLSCHRQIAYSPSTFILDPMGSQEIHYSVSVPADAIGGCYSLILFGGGVVTAKQQDGITVDLKLQMATLFLVEAKDTKKVKGTLKELNILKADANQELEVEAIFKNEGNVRINAKGRLSIIDEEGNAVGWTKFPPIKTLPGNEWRVKTTWAGLPKGKFRLIATFELAPGTILVKESEVTIQ